MSKVSTIHLSLPQWDTGSRKIRCIYLINDTSFTLSECNEKGSATPLFLGADLLSNTDIRTENHPRCHSKFAKKGLASKVNFSSAFRFHGLKVPTANNSLWFYSVEGLFRVAFEMYSKKEQLAVLENFQDVWKFHINDKPLKMSYSLSVQLDSAASNSKCDSETEIQISQHCQAGQSSEEICGNDAGDTSADHDYCCLPPQDIQGEKNKPLYSTVRNKLHGLDDILSSGTQSFTEQQLEIILLFMQYIDHYIHGNLTEKDVTELVLSLVKDTEQNSAYSSTLLNSMGCWLGQQFHSANNNISQVVEGFKVQHIERISELPPAEELAVELFPEAMRTLLLHWMGLSDESSTEKRRSEYPILLLILEFANHNLITGVAHVLYSSLICK